MFYGPKIDVKVKNMAKDGYNAVQFGYGVRNAKNINKPMTGHMKGGNYAHLKELRLQNDSTFAIGDKVDLSVFSNGLPRVITNTNCLT